MGQNQNNLARGGQAEPRRTCSRMRPWKEFVTSRGWSVTVVTVCSKTRTRILGGFCLSRR